MIAGILLISLAIVAWIFGVIQGIEMWKSVIKDFDIIILCFALMMTFLVLLPFGFLIDFLLS